MRTKTSVRWLTVALCWVMIGTLIFPASIHAETTNGLQVTATSPNDEDMEVAVDAAITVAFNEAIEPGEYWDLIVIHSSEGAVRFDSLIAGNTLTLQPQDPLPYDQMVIVYVPEGAVQTTAGFPLQETQIFTFQSEPFPIVELQTPAELTVLHTLPSDLQENVPSDSPAIYSI